MKRFLKLSQVAIAGVLATGLLAATGVCSAQREEHGRKWKALPAEAHIVVTVLKGFNGKPIANAGVVFHAVRDGKNDGNLEVKSDSDGRAVIDLIEVGSHVSVQVIADGFATAAQEVDVDGPNKELLFKMLRPRQQVSAYVDTTGPEKAAKVQPGIQQHVVPKQPNPPVPSAMGGTPEPGK